MKRIPYHVTLDKEAEEMSQFSGIPWESCRLLIDGTGEEYTVAIIKRHLRTDAQKAWLLTNDISIEDMLDGRVEGDDNMNKTDAMFKEWNTRLGRKMFGS
jgi:hypothetical protein